MSRHTDRYEVTTPTGSPARFNAGGFRSAPPDLTLSPNSDDSVVPMLSLPSSSHSVSSSDSSSPWESNSPLQRSDLKATATAKASGGVTSTVAKQPIKGMLNKHNPKGGNLNIERVKSGPFAGAVKKSHQGQEALSLFARPKHNPGFDKDGEMFAPGADVIGDLMAREQGDQEQTPREGGKRKTSKSKRKSKRKTGKSKSKSKRKSSKSKRKHI